MSILQLPYYYKRETPDFTLCFHKRFSRVKNAENAVLVGKIRKNFLGMHGSGPR